MEALMKSLKGSSAGTILSVVNEMTPYVQIDLSTNQLADFAMNASSYLANPFHQLSLPADGAYQSESIRKNAVLVPNIEKIKHCCGSLFIIGEL